MPSLGGNLFDVLTLAILPNLADNSKEYPFQCSGRLYRVERIPESKEETTMKTSVVVSNGTFPCSTAPLQGALPEVAQQASAIGFDALQLTASGPAELPIAGIQEAIRPFGLSVSGIATGRANTVDGLSLGAGEETRRLQTVRRTQELIQAASQLDHGAVVIGSLRGRFADAASPEEYHRQFAASIRQLLPAAEHDQVPLLLESFNHLDADAFYRVRETADFIRSFHSPWLRLQLDSSHLLCEGEDPLEAVREAGDLLGQVDLSGQNRQVPGPGPVDFPRLIRALQEADYQGYLVFEYRPEEDGARRGFRYIQELLKQG